MILQSLLNPLKHVLVTENLHWQNLIKLAKLVFFPVWPDVEEKIEYLVFI